MKTNSDAASNNHEAVLQYCSMQDTWKLCMQIVTRVNGSKHHQNWALCSQQLSTKHWASTNLGKQATTTSSGNTLHANADLTGSA
jgi:hypothetical protein